MSAVLKPAEYRELSLGAGNRAVKQIKFDAVWEGKVVERILHNLSLLMERSFASVQELNRYRKELTPKLAAAAAAAAAGVAPPASGSAPA